MKIAISGNRSCFNGGDSSKFGEPEELCPDGYVAGKYKLIRGQVGPKVLLEKDFNRPIGFCMTLCDNDITCKAFEFAIRGKLMGKCEIFTSYQEPSIDKKHHEKENRLRFDNDWRTCFKVPPQSTYFMHTDKKYGWFSRKDRIISKGYCKIKKWFGGELIREAQPANYDYGQDAWYPEEPAQYAPTYQSTVQVTNPRECFEDKKPWTVKSNEGVFEDIVLTLEMVKDYESRAKYEQLCPERKTNFEYIAKRWLQTKEKVLTKEETGRRL